MKQPELTFSIFRAAVAYSKSIPRSSKRSIKNLGNSAYKRIVKESDLFNLGTCWEKMQSANRPLLGAGIVYIMCFHNG